MRPLESQLWTNGTVVPTQSPGQSDILSILSERQRSPESDYRRKRFSLFSNAIIAACPLAWDGSASNCLVGDIL